MTCAIETSPRDGDVPTALTPICAVPRVDNPTRQSPRASRLASSWARTRVGNNRLPVWDDVVAGAGRHRTRTASRPSLGARWSPRTPSMTAIVCCSSPDRPTERDRACVPRRDSLLADGPVARARHSEPRGAFRRAGVRAAAPTNAPPRGERVLEGYGELACRLHRPRGVRERTACSGQRECTPCRPPRSWDRGVHRACSGQARNRRDSQGDRTRSYRRRLEALARSHERRDEHARDKR
jgi:hypothetical protein